LICRLRNPSAVTFPETTLSKFPWRSAPGLGWAARRKHRFDAFFAQLNCRALRHPLVTFVLILCLCWQSLAQAGSAVALAEAEEAAHAAMHFHGEAHHHDAHGDGGIHQDNSAASLQHLLDDACVFAPALVPGTRLPLMAPALVSPADGLAIAARSPYLDGLERPPRSH
jgi:hypothetical protein